jgi:hypothetical protein
VPDKWFGNELLGKNRADIIKKQDEKAVPHCKIEDTSFKVLNKAAEI